MNPHSELVRGFCAWAMEGLDRVYETGEVYRAPVCEQSHEEFLV